MDLILSNVQSPILAASSCLLASLSLILIVTRLYSSFYSFPAKPHTGHEPPLVPYYLPYVGHLFQFLSNPGGFLQRCRKEFPDTPFSLLLPGAKFHVFSSADTAFFIFTKPRDFICEPVVASMMSNGLELEGEDLKKFDVPISPRRKSPDFTPAQHESFVFVGRNHALYLKYLSGRTLDSTMKLYMKHFLTAMDRRLPPAHTSTTVSLRLHQTLQKLVFDTSCVTFFGQRIYQICPDIWQHWNSFNEAAYIGVRSQASFHLRPWTLLGRRRMLEAFDKWVDTDLEPWDGEDGIWNEKWGVKLNWEREKMSRDHNMSVRGRSCVQVSFLWVIITNAAPMLTWLVTVLLTHPDLLRSFRLKAAESISEGSTDGGLGYEFDISGFSSDPFIQGVWKEALRLGVTSAAARVVTKDSEIEGYTVKKGSVLLVPTRILHFDEDIFEEPAKFNPWRWIGEGVKDKCLTGTFQPVSAERLRRQNNSLRPFGGGTGVCSGRFIAEQEVLMGAALLLHLFDFEIEPGQRIPEPNLNPRGLGAMYPVVDPKVTVRRRKGIS